MKINRSIFWDIVLALLFFALGVFAFVSGVVLDGEKLRDIGVAILGFTFIFVCIIQLRNQELKHYKELKKEIREMQNLADQTP